VSLHAPPVTILTSGIGLGIYIPSLLIQRQLQRIGINADVEVLEAHYTARGQRLHLEHKSAFRDNFSLALIANRMARSVEDWIDAESISELLRNWTREGREDFIVWSGFWLPVLNEYGRKSTGIRLNIDLCRIDAEISASFRAHRDVNLRGTEIWLWNWSKKRLVRNIPISTTPIIPIPLRQRPNKLVVHGGGWGLGTYKTTLPELCRSKYNVDVVVGDAGEKEQLRYCDRCLIIDPTWQPSDRGADKAHSFPPVGEVINSSDVRYRENSEYHEMYNVIRESKAIVSKPGGGTLIDSLNSATPVILLDAFGQAEASNAAIWEYLGYGVPFATWRDTGYDEAVLEKLHANLIARPKLDPGYPLEYAKRFIRRWKMQ
jgi:hypothetical protein